MKIIYTALCLIFVVLVTLLTVAAEVSDLLRLRQNPELTQALSEGRPPERLNWYATSRENIPDAIIGIDPAWGLTSELWHEISVDSTNAKEVFNNVAPYDNKPPLAYDILTPDGTVIGVYWSTISSTVVRIGKGNEVKVFPPDPPVRP